jgi:hypothetical protein
VVESFFFRIKTELFHRQSRRTAQALKDTVTHYIEGWCNARRLHSSLGYLSPNQYEPKRLWTRLRPRDSTFSRGSSQLSFAELSRPCGNAAVPRRPLSLSDAHH